MARRALLLGLDAYRDASLALEAARHDVGFVAETLGLLGYPAGAVEHHPASVEGSLTTADLRRHIRSFLRAAAGGDELLVYLSAHGVDQDGGRLIVPTDYWRDDPMAPNQLLSDHWRYGTGRDCKAASPLIVADACREGVKFVQGRDVRAKGDVADAAPDRPVTVASAPTVAILYSCEPGTKSWAPRTGGASYFTQALCEVLRKDEGVGTLRQLLVAVGEQLPSVLPPGRHQSPYLDERLQITGCAGLPLNLVVKEDLAARLRQRIAASDWCAKLRASGPWSRVEAASAGLARQAEAVVLRAEDLAREAAAALPGDRWRDTGAPARVAERLDLLAGPGAGLLEPAEAAVALLARYVFEAILAGLVLELAACGDPTDPLASAPDSAAPASFRAWREAARTEEALARRWQALKERDATAATDLRCWQLWRFAHRAGELWAYTPGAAAGARGWVGPRLDALFAAAPFPEVAGDRRVLRALDGKRLARLARLLFADAEDIEAERSRREMPLDPAFPIGQGRDVWRLDEPKLAHVLALAGALALDARRLPEIVAEHVGRSDGLDPLAVREGVAEAEWQLDRDGGTITLALECRHPALDAALQEVVRGLEAHRHRLAEEAERCPALAEALPDAFSDRRLRPAPDKDGRPRFARPHLRFSVEQGRMLDLLMGKELYGDPTLALRELYQNALDACRYRRARTQYLARTRPDWAGRGRAGRIVLSVGEEDGRPYVACEDDGVGMGERHLRLLFARAGQRFTDSHEYHLERALWEEAGVAFWPNSRFGIGVLSYFMLADEIRVETRHFEPDGTLGAEGFVARIDGSGSLFRVTSPPGTRPDGGTKVTLYLKSTDTPLKDLLTGAGEWLWLPQVETVFRFQDGSETLHLAGQLTEKPVRTYSTLLPVTNSESGNAIPRAYWIVEDSAIPRYRRHEHGNIVIDGIVTQNPLAVCKILINAVEGVAIEISTDRRRVIDILSAKNWFDDLTCRLLG